MDSYLSGQKPVSLPYPPDRPGQDPYGPSYDDNKPATLSNPKTISVKRSVALGVGSLVAFLVLAVIGLSTGLGISQRDLRNSNNELTKVQAVLATATIVPFAASDIPTPTTSTSSSSSPTPTVKSDVQCPKVNGTIYTSSTSGQRFRRLCGIDYGPGEAVDIGNVPTRNLDACADACASRANCTGAGWGVIEGDKGPLHSCWMKTNLTEPHEAPEVWGFALLVVDEDEEDEEGKGEVNNTTMTVGADDKAML
ncbi:hypothetical protein VTJ49DRAFT_6605 [Mycothermus thermophilus]|uniref:Apple domain-containing protein n=1 Tax=Humicola insolens TaxID=85995 RepID=A0ABR3VIW0_HUMIN